MRNSLETVAPLIFLLCSILAAAEPAPAQTFSPPAHKLTLLQATDPEFDRLLDANFPGFDRLDGYKTFRPFLAILRNDTTHTVRSYMLLWDRVSTSDPNRRPINSSVRQVRSLTCHNRAVPGDPTNIRSSVKP